jgi:hypothetical protein
MTIKFHHFLNEAGLLSDFIPAYTGQGERRIWIPGAYVEKSALVKGLSMEYLLPQPAPEVSFEIDAAGNIVAMDKETVKFRQADRYFISASVSLGISGAIFACSFFTMRL